MEKIKAFFQTTTSNLVGIALGSSLIAINLFEFSVVGIVAGVFLVVAEGLQYWERAMSDLNNL